MNDDQPPSRTQRNFLQKLSQWLTKQNSKADLREYLQEAQDNNIIDHEEAAMMAGVLSVSEQRVRDVMIPKSQMVTVSPELTFDQIIDAVMVSGHSRFPIEHNDEIIGILLAKDLLNYVYQQGISFDIQQIMRPVKLIPESKPLDILLREFRFQRVHMVIVTNEYGDVSGLVTIEDVLEEIVGDIDDEYDLSVGEQIKKLDNTSYWVNALTEVDDFNDFFASQFDADQTDTIGGQILSQFGYVPNQGERICLAGFDFIVKEADERRILALVVKPPLDNPPPDNPLLNNPPLNDPDTDAK
ncbi:HlyC/CorC family transporter [Ostreibacterium oceani]|uniref:Magnesium and cobalt efflux protein CorC n=1 Tax=Ostreibacterium oceani TaxID=2654998 RepID=A0A6N7EUM2_9GAMM|nr:transporter associated domain-containing protein [Ostreibacterium oceani]MPV85210.1 CBS domain-containing protein [Ostreibacterium oceani]